jgi:hypothetical protein
MIVAYKQVPVTESVPVPKDSPVVKYIDRSIKFAQKRMDIDFYCDMAGLSKRHAAQRFRRWKERQGK